MKQFQNFVVDFLNKNINCFHTEGTFLSNFKKVVLHPSQKKIVKLKYLILDQLASYQIFQKFMKDYNMTKCIRTYANFS